MSGSRLRLARFDICAEIDGVEMSGPIWITPGFIGSYTDPPEDPDIERADLVDDRGQAISLDLYDDDIQRLLLGAIVWPP